MENCKSCVEYKWLQDEGRPRCMHFERLIYNTMAAGKCMFYKVKDTEKINCTVCGSEFIKPNNLQKRCFECLSKNRRYMPTPEKIEQDAKLLTPKEQLTLQSMIDANCNVDIVANSQHVSPTTVKSHMHSIFNKLAVNNKAAMCLEGLRRGLVQLNNRSDNETVEL